MHDTQRGSDDRQATKAFRREVRSPHRVPCCLIVADDNALHATQYAGQTTNISERGISIQVARAVPKGHAVEAIVPAPDGSELNLQGIVVHSRQVMADTFELGILVNRSIAS